MKKLLLSTLVSVLFMQLISAQTQPKGNGSINEPYEINSFDELVWLSLNNATWDKNIKLSADIDASASKQLDSEKGFLPIGTKVTPFTGIFDGDNHKISQLIINRLDSSYIGLFGFIGIGAQIKNVEVVNCNIMGNGAVGGLVGSVDSLATVSFCSASGSVIGAKIVGGLVGDNDGKIISCHSLSNSAAINMCGGFVGRNNGEISKSFSTGDADGIDNSTLIGGFIGINLEGIISSCYATGKAGGVKSVGGFAGGNMKGDILFCNSKGKVVCSDWLGGFGSFIGLNMLGKISSCYGVGSVSSSGLYGGFVGMQIGGTIEFNYFDMKATKSKSASASKKEIDGINGLKTKQFADIFSYPNWKLEGTEQNPWILDEDETYPILYWQKL